MGRKRKYPKVQGWWVYNIYVPSINKYYIGVSKMQCWQRWRKSLYKDCSLEEYLQEWDSMEKTVLIDNLTKEEAVTLEDDLIVKYTEQGVCINEVRSGWIEKKDKNAYEREYYQNNKEKDKQYRKQRYQNDAEFRERQKKKARERYHKNKAKKKLEQLQNQLNLF